MRTVGNELFFLTGRGFNQHRSINRKSRSKKAGLHLNHFFEFWRMEDTMAGVFNESLVKKQLEDSSESGTVDTLLNSGDLDTRTGLLNALVICFKPHGQNCSFVFWIY